MLERLNWSVLALAQQADVQEKLFPDFVVVADELALAWEEALEEVKSDEAYVSFDQKEKIEALDKLIVAISGPENLKYWDDDALRRYPEWDQIRAAAAEVARSFDWPVVPPNPSQDIYISNGNGD